MGVGVEVVVLGRAEIRGVVISVDTRASLGKLRWARAWLGRQTIWMTGSTSDYLVIILLGLDAI